MSKTGVIPSSLGELIDRLSALGLLHAAQRIAERHGVSLEDIRGRRRNRTLAKARTQIYALLHMCRDLDGNELSYPEIGALMDRDHSTILKTLRRAGYTRALNLHTATRYRIAD